MKTKFEEYLNNNRNHLDVDNPDDDFIWEGIQSELKPKRSIQIFSWKAAAIILLAVVSGFVLNSVLNPNPNVVQLTLSDVSPEYAKQERFYQASIQQKWSQINKQGYERSDYSEIFKEMEELESLKNESLNDLVELGGNPRLVRTIFEYYEIKIRLLEIMLAEIEKKQNEERKTKNDEKYL